MFQSIFALKILILKGFGDVRAVFDVSMFRTPDCADRPPDGVDNAK